MELRRTYREWLRLLADPQAAFASLSRKSLEQLLAEYATLLIVTGAGAGVFLLLKDLLSALVYSLVLGVDVQYLRLLNYALGGMMAAVFFYVFAGTFLLFIASLILRPLLRLPYVDTLRLLLAALAPCLLFGWLVPAVPGLLVWSGVLVVAGTPVMRRTRRKQRGTIGERE